MNRSMIRFLLSLLLLLSLCIGAFAQETDFIGRWRCQTMVVEEVAHSATDLDWEVIFDFFENGVAELTLNGEAEPITWRVEDGAPVVTDDDGDYLFTRNGDTLEMSLNGTLMYFGREPGAAELIPSGDIAAQEAGFVGKWFCHTLARDDGETLNAADASFELIFDLVKFF